MENTIDRYVSDNLDHDTDPDFASYVAEALKDLRQQDCGSDLETLLQEATEIAYEQWEADGYSAYFQGGQSMQTFLQRIESDNLDQDDDVFVEKLFDKFDVFYAQTPSAEFEDILSVAVIVLIDEIFYINDEPVNVCQYHIP